MVMAVPGSDRYIPSFRLFIGLGSYLFWLGLGVTAHFLNLLPLSAQFLLFFGIGVVATSLIFLWLILSGWSARFKDPSLTAFQVAVALAWCLVHVAVVPEARLELIIVFMIALSFGVFQVDLRQTLILVAGFFTAYVGILIFEHWQGLALGGMSRQLFILGLYLIVGVWMCVFLNYLQRIRIKLFERSQALELAVNKINKLAITDELTGIFNRRHMLTLLNKQVSLGQRFQRPFCLVLVDVDYFKRINDRLGHQAGDRALREISRTILEELRSVDTVGVSDSANLGRYGGEEFILVLPETGAEQALIAMERVRKAVERTQPGFLGEDLRMTVSAGIAEWEANDTSESLLQRADKALYAAKNAGRNQCRIAA